MTDIWLYGNPMWVTIVIMTLRKRYENPYCNEPLSNYEGITLVSLINKSWGTSIITRWQSAWIDQRFRISWQFQLRQLIVIGEIRSQPPTLISTHMSLLLCVLPVGLVSNLPNILIGIFSLPIPSISTTSPNSKRKCFSPLCDASCLYPTPLIHFFILYSTWLHLTSINNGTKLDVLKILLKPFFFPSSSLINRHGSL